MLILALETSTELGSCALWRDGVVTERFCPEKQPHSETLLPLVRELLAESGVRIADLDAIAFGVGPGAFTGLRVACGAAQGLAVAADLPLVAVTSLETMAAQSSAERVLACSMRGWVRSIPGFMNVRAMAMYCAATFAFQHPPMSSCRATRTGGLRQRPVGLSAPAGTPSGGRPAG
jgi:tRNA threonylcarbamoyl adenosine modification protein YeaZ